MLPLPIDAHLGRIRSAVAAARATVIVAAPGAGKTTRVPPVLAADGPVIVLQPRRVAARAMARRIAEEQGWTLGRDVGWHVRFERRFRDDTRVLLATEGILTARLRDDPLASGFRTIVLDEFHERSIHADLGLALARQAWLARDDLHVVVMSATIDPAPVSRFLGDCPVIEIAGAPHPLEIEYAPGASVAEAAAAMWAQSRGTVLCFLPGAPEIRRAEPEVRRAVPAADVLILHGGLPPDEQDRAIAAAAARRLILATNLAETSLTVPGVDAVVDTGLHKVARYDAARAIDALALERISQASADQRAGRAARLGPGRVCRLWDPRDRLRPQREPDVARIDLAGTVLDLAAWGAEVDRFEWFEPPPPAALQSAADLLQRLGALETGRLTPLGRTLQRLPLPPRLARILAAAGGARTAARACALLSERQPLPPRHEATSCDLLAALDDWSQAPPHLQQVARDLEERSEPGNSSPSLDETALRRAIFAGYPDRLGQRRSPGSARVRLSSGTGGVVGPESGVRDGEYLVALDLVAPTRAGETEARIRLASRVEPEWIVPTGQETVCAFDAVSGRVRAVRRTRYDALVLAERPQAPDPHEAAAILAEAWLAAPRSERDAQLLRRLAFAGLAVDLPALVRAASLTAATLDAIDPAAHLPFALARELDRRAPLQLVLPTGRRLRLEYRDEGSVAAAVKLQDLFGTAETPVVGPDRVPVLLSLLAPNGRPVQTTRDLPSFWSTTYAEVRRELRGRYPRHAWPEDPWTASPRPR